MQRRFRGRTAIHVGDDRLRCPRHIVGPFRHACCSFEGRVCPDKLGDLMADRARAGGRVFCRCGDLQRKAERNGLFCRDHFATDFHLERDFDADALGDGQGQGFTFRNLFGT